MLHLDSPNNSSANRLVTLRLLQIGIFAALVMPVVLFVFASAISYRNISAIAEERAARALDVLQEQALKVFRPLMPLSIPSRNWWPIARTGDRGRPRPPSPALQTHGGSLSRNPVHLAL
jgi:hypothetical protein